MPHDPVLPPALPGTLVDHHRIDLTTAVPAGPSACLEVRQLHTESRTFKPPTHFTLGACAPNGDLLLVHTKQHPILRVPPEAPADLTGPAGAGRGQGRAQPGRSTLPAAACARTRAR
ncbi:hypothetical protein ACFV0H_11960 [Streptomyces erythrochromogenes]|uniref:hypothetical protein n=1 Tax=Streptomyces erythrochromogenes TaxID=285574 RepID=UPI0036BE455E